MGRYSHLYSRHKTNARGHHDLCIRGFGRSEDFLRSSKVKMLRLPLLISRFPAKLRSHAVHNVRQGTDGMTTNYRSISSCSIMLSKIVAPELRNSVPKEFSPAVCAHVQRVLEKSQEENCIVIHTAFVGGGRVNGISDPSSDFDIYAFFLPANPLVCQLRRSLRTPDALDKTIKIQGDSAVDEAGAQVDIEYRFWDVEKIMEMLWSENGDAVDWFRPPTVLCSRGTFYKDLFDSTAALHERRFGNYAALCVARKYFGILNTGLNSATQDALQALGVPKSVKGKDAATPGPDPVVLYAIPTLSVKQWMNFAHASLVVEYQLQNYDVVAPINFDQLIREVKLPDHVAVFLRELRVKRGSAFSKHDPVAIGADIYAWMDGIRTACMARLSSLDDMRYSNPSAVTERRKAPFEAIETGFMRAQEECGLLAPLASTATSDLASAASRCKSEM